MELFLVVTWLVVLLGLTVVGTPIAMAILRPLPARGVALGLPISLAWLVFGSFWIGQWRLSFVTITIVVASLVIASIVCYRRVGPPPVDAVLEVVLLVMVAFFVMVWFRAGDPAVTPFAGEKFLDYSLVRALLRTEALPPVDPWFAGEPVRYYYGGHLLVAGFAILTATEAAFAYNLGFAVVFAATIATAYGVTSEVGGEIDAPRRVAGLLGVAFVTIVANLAPLARLIGWLLPGGLGEWWAELFNLGEGGLLDGPFDFFYWNASRVIPAGTDSFDYLINEFPLFAFVHGDLHAHLMAAPFVLLYIAALFALYRSGASPRQYRLVLLLGVLPVLLALLVIVNTWSVITAIGMTGVVLLSMPHGPFGNGHSFDESAMTDPTTVGRRLVLTGGTVASVAVVAIVLVAPFVINTRADTGIGLIPHRTPLTALLVIYGAFLLIAYLGIGERLDLDRSNALSVAGAGLLAIAVFELVQASAVIVFGTLVVVAGWLVFTDRDRSFVLVLLVCAAGLIVTLEFVYVDDPSSWERLNTVFKLGFDAWLLWGVVTGAFLAERFGTVGEIEHPLGKGRTTGVPLAIIVLVIVGLYAGFVLVEHTATARDDTTLDARVYLEANHPNEVPAISWLDAQDGVETIVEAPGTSMYRWINPASSLTAHPTIAGWRHAANYQGNYPGYLERVDDVQVIYEGTPAERAPVLERYDVTYVYVGPTERSVYDIAVDDDPSLTPAFSARGVTIYEVDRA